MQTWLCDIRELIPANFNPEQHRDLEQFKERGRALQRSGKDTAERTKGVLVEIFCHFHRSRNAAHSSGRKHPEFEEYAVHWLYSDLLSHSTPEHIALMSCAKEPRSLKIAEGTSYWHYRKPRS